MVNMEDFETPVKLYVCKANLSNALKCSDGEQIIFIKDESKCFEIDGWFIFNRQGVLLAGEWSDTCAPETFSELAWEATDSGSCIVRENSE